MLHVVKCFYCTNSDSDDRWWICQGPEAETETALLAPRDDDRHSAKHGSLATYSVTLLDGTAIELEVSVCVLISVTSYWPSSLLLWIECMLTE